MTYQEFQERIKKEDASNKYGNYFTAVLFLCIGLYFAYLVNFTNWYVEKQRTTENIVPIWMVHGLAVSFVLAGLYGFWRIPQDYKITTISSKKSIAEKRQIMDQLKGDFKLFQQSEAENYGRYSYAKSFGVQFGIHILVDDKGFYLNAQRIVHNGGIIDFGSSKRATDKIRNKILSYL